MVENKDQCLVLIKTRNAPIPAMKILQIEYYTGFFKLDWKMRCSLNSKAQAVKKAQVQLRPEPYFPEFLIAGSEESPDPGLSFVFQHI